jgi:hypothetical protein
MFTVLPVNSISGILVPAGGLAVPKNDAGGDVDSFRRTFADNADRPALLGGRMKAKLETKTVDDLLQWKANKMLTVNAEYQRDVVWKDSQRKWLIDSVMRGYPPIPLIYLHHISREVAGARREDFEIIDGQQRIEALYAYKEGAFKLFHPVADEEEAGFPSFIKNQSCPWGGKRFEELTPALQEQLLKTSLSVVMIETNIPNEARDLFIRLQGMPLNSQRKSVSREHGKLDQEQIL